MLILWLILFAVGIVYFLFFGSQKKEPTTSVRHTDKKTDQETGTTKNSYIEVTEKVKALVSIKRGQADFKKLTVIRLEVSDADQGFDEFTG